MKIEKPSQVLALAAWISVFFVAWLLVLRLIPSDWISWGFMIFFFVLAVLSAVASAKRIG